MRKVSIIKILTLLLFVQILLLPFRVNALEVDDEVWDKLKIGAFVDYHPESSEITLLKEYTGTDEDQVISTEDLQTWRILNINKEEGTIDIISGNPTPITISLKGSQGYNNGVYLLNEVSRELYSNEELDATARSINELDIIDKFKDDSYKDYTEYDLDGNITYQYGEEVDYSNRGVYPTQWLNDDSDEDYLSGLSKDRDLIDSNDSRGGMYNDPINAKGTYYKIDDWNSIFMKVDEDKQINIIGSGNNIYRDVIFFGDDTSTDRYWLASRFVDTRNKDQVLFGIVYVHGNIVKASLGGSANWWSSKRSFSLRPIVTIPISMIDFDALERDGTKTRPFKLGHDDTKATITFKDQNLYNEVVEQIKDIVTLESEPDYLSITISNDELNNIKKLNLNNKDIIDITGIGRFTGLEELYICNNGLEDISTISTLTNLKKLEIYGNSIVDISSLSGLINLKELSIAKNKVEDISFIKELTNLEYLDLSHNLISNITYLENLVNLKNLNLFDNYVHDLTGLGTLTNLEVLNLGENNEINSVNMTNLDTLRSLVNLKELDFSCNYEPNIINYIDELNTLDKLNLARNNLNDRYVTGKINKLTNLKELNLYGNYIWTITPLTSLTNLEVLNLQNNLFPKLKGILVNGELVWNNLKELSIAGITNLDSESEEVKYLINRFNNNTLLLNYDYLTDTTNLPHIDSDGTKYVTYEDFGARCDGVFDDFIAIRNAHNFANKYGYEVRATAGKTYHIFKYYEDSAYIRGNVNWNNATFIIHDENIEDVKGRFEHIFVIQNAPEEDIVIINNSTWTIDKNTKQLVNINDYLTILNSKGYKKYLVVVENANKKQFIRYGYNANSGYNQQDTFIIDSDGILLNDVVWDFDEITRVRIIPISNDKTYVKNGNFISNALISQSETNYSRPNKSIYFQRNIYVTKSGNIELSNIKHSLSEDVVSGSYFGFIFSVYCADMNLSDIKLHARLYTTTVRSTYDFTMHNSVNVYLYNVTSEDIFNPSRWGITGTKFSKDVVFDNCYLNRVDAHEGIYNLTVKNSTIGAKGVGTTGFGTLNIINCNLQSQALFGLRGDYGSFWNGTINIIDSTFIHESIWAWSIVSFDLEAIGVGHDFGYDCMFPDVYIENIIFDGYNKPDTKNFYIFPLWDSAIANNVPKSYWDSNFIINGFKFINFNNEDPALRISTMDLNNMIGNYVFINAKLIDSNGNDLSHKFMTADEVVVNNDLNLTIDENATAKNYISIYKDNELIIDNLLITDTFNYIFSEDGKYSVILKSIENYYGKDGSLVYNFEIKKAKEEEPIEAPDDIVYEIVEGADREVDVNEDLFIKANGSIDKFMKLLVNDIELSRDYYTVKSGSTLVTLKSSYLSTLEAGTYKLTFIYTDGDVSTTFTIPNNVKNIPNNNPININVENNTNNIIEVNNSSYNNPHTSDSIISYLIILIISFVGIVFCKYLLLKEE